MVDIDKKVMDKLESNDYLDGIVAGIEKGIAHVILEDENEVFNFYLPSKEVTRYGAEIGSNIRIIISDDKNNNPDIAIKLLESEEIRDNSSDMTHNDRIKYAQRNREIKKW